MTQGGLAATGGCLCSEVSYRVTGQLRPVVACHCTLCRRASGHHVAATSAPRDAVEVEGDVTWFESSPGVRRGFCGICGSNLFWDGGGANLSIGAGTLDDTSGLEMRAHIWCGAKGAYYAIADGLPQFDEGDT